NTQLHREDTFSYQVTDGKNVSGVGVVGILPERQSQNQSPTQQAPPQEAPTVPLVNTTNIAPVSHDVFGETEPGASVQIMLDATDQDSKSLTARIVKEPDCGSEILDQTVGSLLYTAKSPSTISGSACKGDPVNGWQDSITYTVSDGEHESNVAKILVKINPSKEVSVNPAISSNKSNPEVKLTGPNNAQPGQSVTLVGNLTGINQSQISSIKFTQEKGMNITYTECVNYLQCSSPTISFIMPQCPVEDNSFRFRISVTEYNLAEHDDTHTIKLKCSDQ